MLKKIILSRASVQLNTATSVSNLESEYLEEENGQPVKPSSKTTATTPNEKKSAIETASNKRMRSANINAWTLRFNDESLESKVKIYFAFISPSSKEQLFVKYIILNKISK